jgi:hypothetical protein
MPRVSKAKAITPNLTLMPPTIFEQIRSYFTGHMALKVAAFIGILLVGLFIISVMFASLNTARSKGSFGTSAYPSGGYAESSYPSQMGMNMGAPALLSSRNMLDVGGLSKPGMPVPADSYTSGNTAEALSITDYYAQVETAALEQTCSAVSDLKEHDYVIFENASQSKRDCSYRFKVQHGFVDEVLQKVKDLEPIALTENTYTIKNQLDDFTNQFEILENKRNAIDATLESAILAYDDITDLATKSKDAQSLAARLSCARQS